MSMAEEEIEIGKLYDQLLAEGYEIEDNGKYELIRCPGLEILTYGSRYVKVNCLSRHKTPKHLIRILIEAKAESENRIKGDGLSGGLKNAVCRRSVTVTTDHVCMIYNKDHFFENVDAKNLNAGDYVSVYSAEAGMELIGTITGIEDLGTTEEYVYDVMVDDDMHAFYADDVLIHNSIFLNLEAVSSWMKREYRLDQKIRSWPKKYRDLLWKTMTDFVDNEVNPYIRGLAHDYCGTSNQNVLTYELEYMSDTVLIEGKKHYATRKLYDEGDPVDKIKVSGIELKKGNVPKNIKEFLWVCYKGAIENDWTEQDFRLYIEDLYEKFKTFSIGEVSFWKGYNTERAASGFLQMAQSVNPVTGKTIGTTGIAKAATYYNQIVEKMGLGKKYETLRVGDKCRFLYIDENNPYRIDVMAYKDGQWPAEFDGMFKPDYRKMFDKLILDPLKRFREACGFHDIDPSKQVVFDVFDL